MPLGVIYVSFLRFSFLSFEVVIWSPGRGMEFSNPTRTKTTTREMDNKKRAI